MAAKYIANPTELTTIVDDVSLAAAFGAGTEFAILLPIQGSPLFTWQTIFSAAPASITLLLEASTNGIDWDTVDTSTSTAGETRTLEGSHKFLRINNSAVTGGAGITVTVNLVYTNRVEVGSFASGDVVGPASSTDNAIARWDGATGLLLQDSVPLVTDAGEVLAGNGAASTPTFAFVSQPALGFYRFSAGRMRIRADRFEIVNLTDSLDMFDALRVSATQSDITLGGLVSQTVNGTITWISDSVGNPFWRQNNNANTFNLDTFYGQHTASRDLTITSGANLVQSLDSGNFEFGNPLLAPSGSAAAPGISFASETGNNTGFYLLGDNNIGFTAGGILVWQMRSDGLVVSAGGNAGIWAGDFLDLGSAGDTRLIKVSAGVVRLANATVGSIRALLGGGAAVASATALPIPTGRVFHVTGTTDITSITSTNFESGAVITLIFDDVLTFTDGNNLKLAGNFVTSADDTITLVYDGSNWYETSRSVN